MCFVYVLPSGRTSHHFHSAKSTKSNSSQVCKNKVKLEKRRKRVAGEGGRRGGRVAGLAFGGRELAQERGDGIGFGDLLGEGALHVLDGRVGARVEQQLHDVGELAGRCCGGKELKMRSWERKQGLRSRCDTDGPIRFVWCKFKQVSRVEGSLDTAAFWVREFFGLYVVTDSPPRSV